jgi:hypothetical protein
MSVRKRQSYSDALRDPRWQKKRLEIMNRDGFACTKCGHTEKTLNVHHRWYVRGRKPWEYESKQLTTLCEPCHERETLIQDRLCGALASLDSHWIRLLGDLAHGLMDSHLNPSDIKAQAPRDYHREFIEPRQKSQASIQ